LPFAKMPLANCHFFQRHLFRSLMSIMRQQEFGETSFELKLLPPFSTYVCIQQGCNKDGTVCITRLCPTKISKLLHKCVVTYVFCRAARWHIFKPRNPSLGTFMGSCNGRCWSILWPFGLFYGHLVYFKDLWYIFSVLVCSANENLATVRNLRGET
jgi:hypothetical protein